jgi:basic amino acid/polyamine antiporter, APA family
MLKRSLSLVHLISFVMSMMIGSGVFYLGAYVLYVSDSSTLLSLIAWTIAGVFSLLIALNYVELGMMFPRSGGTYVFLKEAYSQRLASIFGYTGFLLSGSGSIAALALAFANLVKQVNPNLATSSALLASILIITLTGLAMQNITQNAFVSLLITGAKVLGLGVVIVAGLSLGDVPLTSSLPSSLSVSGFVSMLAFASIVSLWAYEGWANVFSLGDEMSDKPKVVLWAIILGIGGVTLLYVLFHLAIYRSVPLLTLLENLGAGNLYFATLAMESLFGSTGAWFMNVLMIVSIVGTLHAIIVIFPRVYYAMAKDGQFFEVAKEVNEQASPYKATLLSMVMSIILVFTFTLIELTSFVVLQGLIYSALVILGLIVLRIKKPNHPRPYKVLLYPITPIVSLIFLGYFIYNTYLNDPRSALIGLILPLGLWMILWLLGRKQKQAS